MTGSCTGGLGSAGLQLAQNSTKTSLPPEGALDASLTVAVVLVPPVTVLGLKLIELTVTPGVWVRAPSTVLSPRLAVT